jgi:molybdopterin-guanine dinucleotide biosynthesis adapter protein
MKTIGVVGFKKSGKTTLAIALAKALQGKGYRVAMIKHTSKPIDHGNTDSGQFINEIPQVAIITPEHSEIILGGYKDLMQIIPYFSADFFIVEGFKSLKYFPKIICLRKEDEKKELSDGLALFTAGLDVSLKDKKIIDYLITDEKDTAEMVTQIENRGFMLPDMNCGECGYRNCYALAQEIVKGTASEQDCLYGQNNISVTVNKKKIFLNHFLSQLYQNMIYGMLSPLKNIDSLDNKQIEIKLNLTSNSKKK